MYNNGTPAKRKKRYDAKIGLVLTAKMRDALVTIADKQDIDYSNVLRECLKAGLKALYGVEDV